MQPLESKFKSQIGKALHNARRDDNVIQEGNSPIMLVPCIITGRVGDCIGGKLKSVNIGMIYLRTYLCRVDS